MPQLARSSMKLSPFLRLRERTLQQPHGSDRAALKLAMHVTGRESSSRSSTSFHGRTGLPFADFFARASDSASTTSVKPRGPSALIQNEYHNRLARHNVKAKAAARGALIGLRKAVFKKAPGTGIHH